MSFECLASFVCVECGCTKHCVPVDGPNGITCDVCYGVIQEKQSSVAKAVAQAAGGFYSNYLGVDLTWNLKYVCPVCFAICTDPIQAAAHCPPIPMP